VKDGAWFPYMLVGFLLISVGANIYLVIRATNDPSFAVEPDYYAKAVDWDELQAQRVASERLGWEAAITLGAGELTVTLTDRAGIPVDDARVEVEVFHNARAQDRIIEQLEPVGPGRYTLTRTFARSGLWEIRLSAVRDADRFVYTTMEELL
jgi:nitrogen fixation protein FixH